MEPARELVGRSAPIEALRDNIRRVVERGLASPRPPAILLNGETGTGKGLIANLLHRLGPRAGGPFVDVNCAAIPDTLLEAEFFGFERGAFTDARRAKPGLFQAAHRGTLFLDEVGLLPEAMQAKLLKVIEERAVRRLGSTRTEAADVWIISATNTDLGTAARARRFREDLYHRLAVLTLTVPPLRERGADVLLLAEHFLSRASRDYGLPARSLSADARARLLTYPWPGNVRELANVMERAALLAESSLVTGSLLNLADPPLASRAPSRPRRGTKATDRASRDRLQGVLEETGGNISQAARALGIARNTLRAYIEKFQLRVTGPGAVSPDPAGDTERLGGPRTASPLAVGSGGGSPSLQWEQRLVTLVAARLYGARDDDRSFELAPILEALVAKARSFGGGVQELTPTGLVVAFGFDPMEDGPARGAHTALAMLKAVERLAGESAQTLSVRVAVHARRCVVGRLGDVTGMAADDRARAWAVLGGLLEQAAANSIATEPETERFLARRFELQAENGLEAGRPRVYRIIGRERSGFEVGGRALTPCVGREGELSALHERLARAESGAGQIVGVVGEPGVGKSRLVYEFRRALTPERVTYVEGRCLAYAGMVPDSPLAALVRQSLDLGDEEGAELVASKLRGGLRSLGLEADEPRIAVLLRLLGHQGGADGLAMLTPAALKRKSHEALTDIALATSRRRPVVIVVEDWQWIDQASEEALAALARSIQESAILLLATYRPGGCPPWIECPYGRQLAVPRLSRGASLDVLRSVSREHEPSATLADRILARAEGVPFYLEELARAVLEVSPLRSDLPIPETIHEAILARLGRLSHGERSLLEVAAVIGRDVSLPILEALADLSESALHRLLGGLQSAAFLYQSRSGPGATYTFTHALTQDTAYRSVPEERRQILHARVAQAVEKLSPDLRARQAELLAHHYTQAGLWPTAIGCWASAGQQAIGRSANGEAVTFLTRGLELLEKLPEGRARARHELSLQRALAAALVAHRGYAAEGVAETLARVRALTEELGDLPELTPVRFALWRFHTARADFRGAEAFATELLAAGDRSGGAEHLVAGHTACGITRFYLGQLSLAREHLEAAGAHHDASRAPAEVAAYGQDLGVGALGYLAWALTLMGHLDGGAVAGDRALARARARGHPFSLALALLCIANVRCARRESALVASHSAELLTLSREQGFGLFTALAVGLSGWALAHDGQAHRGVALMREGAELFRAAHQRVGLRHRAELGEGLVGIGACDEAVEVLDNAISDARASGERALLSEVYRVKAEALWSRDASDPEADTLAAEAVDLALAQGASLLALRAAISLVRTHRERGDDSPAKPTLVRIYAGFREGLELAELRAARALIDGHPA